MFGPPLSIPLASLTLAHLVFSSDSKAHQPDFMANDICSDMSEKKVRLMGRNFRVPMDVHLLIHGGDDSVLNSHIEYSAIYHDQLRASI